MNTHGHFNEPKLTIHLLLVSPLALGAEHNDLVELPVASASAQATVNALIAIIQNERPLMLSKAASAAAFFTPFTFIKTRNFVEYLVLIR